MVIAVYNSLIRIALKLSPSYSLGELSLNVWDVSFLPILFVLGMTGYNELRMRRQLYLELYLFIAIRYILSNSYVVSEVSI